MSLMIGLPCAGGIVSEKTTLGLFNLGKSFVRNNIHHGLLIYQGKVEVHQVHQVLVELVLTFQVQHLQVYYH